MDRKKEKGEFQAKTRFRRDLQRLRREITELMNMSKEYWEGFRMERDYETRVYINKDGIKLFQSSTIEAESQPPHGSPILSISLIYMYVHMYISESNG